MVGVGIFGAAITVALAQQGRSLGIPPRTIPQRTRPHCGRADAAETTSTPSRSTASTLSFTTDPRLFPIPRTISRRPPSEPRQQLLSRSTTADLYRSYGLLRRKNPTLPYFRRRLRHGRRTTPRRQAEQQIDPCPSQYVHHSSKPTDRRKRSCEPHAYTGLGRSDGNGF